MGQSGWEGSFQGSGHMYICMTETSTLLISYTPIYFPGGASAQEPTCQCRRCKRCGLNTWVRKIPWRRAWQSTPVFLLGESHGQRSLVGYSPWGCKELDTTEQLHFHFSLSCIGEGNGNPLQCCCLENPRDGGAWWAAIYGVAQGRTQLK